MKNGTAMKIFLSITTNNIMIKFRLLRLGVDGIEIYSEMKDEVNFHKIKLNN